MPLYDYKCLACEYRSMEFVWTTATDKITCPRCGKEMVRLFTTTAMPLLNRQKPRPFRHNPGECNADKDIWLSVVADAEKGKLVKGELEYWKKEVEKNNPDLIL